MRSILKLLLRVTLGAGVCVSLDSDGSRLPSGSGSCLRVNVALAACFERCVVLGLCDACWRLGHVDVAVAASSYVLPSVTTHHRDCHARL